MSSLNKTEQWLCQKRNSCAVAHKNWSEWTTSGGSLERNRRFENSWTGGKERKVRKQWMKKSEKDVEKNCFIKYK